MVINNRLVLLVIAKGYIIYIISNVMLDKVYYVTETPKLVIIIEGA